MLSLSFNVSEFNQVLHHGCAKFSSHFDYDFSFERFFTISATSQVLATLHLLPEQDCSLGARHSTCFWFHLVCFHLIPMYDFVRKLHFENQFFKRTYIYVTS